MSPKRKKKKIIIKELKKSEKDTGSIEVQIGLLTQEIKDLINHLEKNRKDKSAKRSLIKKVSKRRKFLRYLKNNDPKAYEKVIKELSLKK